MPVKILQLHKRSSYTFGNIQDKYAVSEDLSTFAIADGATQGFHSEKWAAQLAEKFVVQPFFDPIQWIETLRKEANVFKTVSFEYSANPAMASLEKTKEKKGATSTFVGVQLTDNRIRLISCGDSNLLVVDKDKKAGYPFNDLPALEANRFFLNTQQILEEKVTPDYFSSEVIQLQDHDAIILCSDALSRLLLALPETAELIIGISTFGELYQFCMEYWDNKQLQEDDITAIIIQQPIDKLTVILPPEDFSFPKEQEIEFVPGNLSEQYLNGEEMQDLRPQLFQLQQDILLLKKKSGFQEILLKICLGLIALNMFVLIFLYFITDNEPQKIPVSVELPKPTTKPSDDEENLTKTNLPVNAPDSNIVIDQLDTANKVLQSKQDTPVAKALHDKPVNKLISSDKKKKAPKIKTK
jgi:serine/threonine protein phosphatase PrpC